MSPLQSAQDCGSKGRGPVPRIRLQPLTRARIASSGAAGAAWLAALPDLLRGLATDWSLELGRPLPGGSSSYVVAVRAAGRPAVLKVALPSADPDLGFPAQVRTLDRADGRGYACLLRADSSRHALLLEALGPSLDAAALAPETKLRILAGTLRRAWMPAQDQPPLDKAGQLGAFVTRAWEELGRPCSQSVVTQALAYARVRAASPGNRLRVLHGDPHPANALLVPEPRAGAESGYCFVDPDGFVGDCAYDLGVVLRDWSSQLTATLDGRARGLAERYCALLATETGIGFEPIWEWGFLERVSTGLYVMSFGATAMGRRFLAAAERLLD